MSTANALEIAAENGVSAFRMRMWNSPCADGRCEPREYSYANITGVLEMAARCKEAGLDYILDLQ